jgi:hypothetical protein
MRRSIADTYSDEVKLFFQEPFRVYYMALDRLLMRSFGISDLADDFGEVFEQ